MNNPNQPAHPTTVHKIKDDEIETISFTGITKLEYFTGMALQGLLSSNNGQTADHLVRKAVQTAKDILTELDK